MTELAPRSIPNSILLTHTYSNRRAVLLTTVQNLKQSEPPNNLMGTIKT
ncbi:MAG: hypothetical protein HC879_21070 [Leptolyngbyaceae cyanobacterium SL_5_9]|nr:hypothetical protein [Leptolyngbyaceae cyanobacterium SL_5_9]NJO72929.1 hypothetical protein [Leptolyngbyaceae cyanobacterium RM1_406_9]